MKTFLSVLSICFATGICAQDVQSGTNCMLPYNVQVENITMNSAIIHWGVYSGPPPESYILKYMDGMISPSKWMTIDNITDTSYTLTNLKPNNGYSVKVAAVCGNGITSKYAPYRSSLDFSTNAKGDYCWAYGNGNNYIEGFRLGGVNYKSGDNKGYGDYVSTKIHLNANQAYKMYLKGFIWSSINPSCQFRVYIDFNQNKTFEANELAGSAITTKSDSVVDLNFKIPATAKNGDTRLRIVYEETWFTYNSPCNYNTNGETEDYTVHISGGAKQDLSTLKNNSLENTVFSTLQISPNPVTNGPISIQYRLIQQGKVQINIRDYMGKTVQLIDMGIAGIGSFTEKLNVQNLIPGIYQVNLLQNGRIIQQQKLVVVH